ncbi:hypothetical protein Tco_1047324 [Tanacetum coccineum]
MEDPNIISMEEYIRLEKEKAHRRAIVFNDELKSEEALSCEPTNLYVPFGIPFDPSGFIRMSFKRGSCGDQDMALPPRYQIHQYLRFEGLGYTNADITDFEERLGRIYGREIHRVRVFNFEGFIELMAEGLSGSMLMEHMDAQG